MSLFLLAVMTGAAAWSACRDCAQPGFGGPAENPFTAYDAICRSDLCRAAGFPQVFVNASNLALYVKVTDLTFGGPPPGFSLDRSFNQDDTHAGPFGVGWSFNIGDSLTPDADGTLVLRRGSGRIDRFATAAPGAGFFAVTATADTLTMTSDGTYTLRSPGSTISGSTWSRIFAAGGQLLAIQESGATLVSLDYDKSGNLTAAHYRGRLLQFSYDGNGHIASVSDSAGRTVSYAYSSDGRLTQQTNAGGQAVKYAYDGSGNLVSIGSIAVAYGGDPGFTAVASVTTADGAVRKYDIPNTPEQIRLTDGNGDATLYVSNAAGLLLSVTDANSNTVSYSYDASGRRISTVDGLGEISKFIYDANGNLTGATDGAGNRWSADYSAASSGLAAYSAASSGPAAYSAASSGPADYPGASSGPAAYSAASSGSADYPVASSGPVGAGPAHITDPNGNVWALKYDASGNPIAVQNPAGGGLTATRSPAELISSLTDGLGNKTSYQYNSDGLLTTFIDALSGAWTYQYDGAAAVSARTDPGGTVLKAVAPNLSGFARDSLNRLVSYTDSFGNQVGYQYDGAGQLTAMTLPGGNAVTYQYDHAHRLTTVSDWLGNFALYRYDAAGWPVSVSVSGGPVTIYQYDAGRRLRAIVSTGPDGSPVAGYRYTLDADGNRTAVSALEPNTSPFTIPAYSFTMNAANHPVSRSDGETYQYDARGNLAAIQGPGAATLTYDASGRLQSFNAASSTSYTYDPSGLRVVRTVNGTDRRFLNDPSGAVPRVVMEMDGSNTPIAWYVYGLGLLWKVTADGTAYFYHFDGDGNVVAVSNPTAGVVNEYRYDATGVLVAANEGVENMFRAHGESGWIDDGNGLVFANRAYQFPALGLTLPAVADPSPPQPGVLPPFSGAGACFVQGVANCPFSTGRRRS